MRQDQQGISDWGLTPIGNALQVTTTGTPKLSPYETRRVSAAGMRLNVTVRKLVHVDFEHRLDFDHSE